MRVNLQPVGLHGAPPMSFGEALWLDVEALALQQETLGKNNVVLTTTLEHAELKRDQIHAFGKDDLVAGCKGSMRATIEAAE